jgi:hypothetical protein
MPLGRKSLRWSGPLLATLAAIPGARADVFELTGGGKIEGVALPDPAPEGLILIQTMGSKSPLKFRKEQIRQVIRQAGPLDDYLKLRERASKDAGANYELGRWCERQKMAGLATVHFEAAIAADPDHAGAREKLGHVHHHGEWLTNDELKVKQGWIKFKGRWMSPEEKDRLDQDETRSAENAAWARRIRVHLDALRRGPADRYQQAEAAILAIEDPLAVPALVKGFAKEKPELRMLMARSLSGIRGPESSRAMTDRLLIEGDPSVRSTLKEELSRRDDPAPVAQLVRSLRSEDQAVRGRAADALAGLQVRRAVPNLIDSLVTVKRRLIFTEEPVSGGGTGIGFSSVTPAPANGGGGGIVSGTSTGVATTATAVVAPGVSVLVPQPMAIGTGIGLGSGMQTQPATRVVTKVFQNPEVLRALRTLTGEDFAYDVGAWKRWLATAFQSSIEVRRRVPQP